MLPAFDLVVARTLNKRAIGKANTIPWKLPKDLAFFKSITSQGSKKNVCVMGRKTFESIGKPLPNRYNVVVSRSSTLKIPGIYQAGSFKQALAVSDNLIQNDKSGKQQSGRIFVIGGQKIFQEAIPDCRYIFQTRVNFKDDGCDTFFPEHKFQPGYISKVFRENNINFDFCQFQNPQNKQKFKKEINMPRNEQLQYLDIVKKIIDFGEDKIDRTKTGTRGLFGDMMRFDLSQGFPILTTKRVFWKGVVEELFWFIKGATNNQLLKDKKVNIWNGNGTKQYLHSIGLTDREQGDLGPVYGFQWRHWGAPYSNMHADYTNKGIDQLSKLIHDIKNKPNSRRLIMSAWNVSQLHQMALPPCHVMCHFQVTNNNKLNCIMYQRSCDMGLGVPFNIASYALLTCMIAQVCGLERGEFIHMMGDTHLYSDHIPKLQPQLNRVPYPFPYLKLSPEVKNIEDFKCEHINLEGYKSHGKIEMKMSV